MIKLGQVDVVGIPYTLYLYENEFKKLNDDAIERDKRYGKEHTNEPTVDGYCDYQQKEIRVFIDEYTDLNYFKSVLRHEITHAFLFEIGNSNCDNEEFIDKISKWVPHISNIFDKGMGLIADARCKN